MGCVVTGELRVNIAELRAGALGLQDAADALPDPPSAFPSLGADRLAQALTSRTNEIEAPLVESLPTTRTDARATATNIGMAADRYEKTDQQAHSDVSDRLAEFDSKFGSSSSNGGGATDAMGQFGQMMQMPMQMAQQLGQIPMQIAQQAGQIPQTIMQGVQQFAQMGGGSARTVQVPMVAPVPIPRAGPDAVQQTSADGEDREEPGEREDQEEKPDGAAASDGGEQRAPVAEAPVEAAPADPPLEAVPAQPKRPPVDPSVLL